MTLSPRSLPLLLLAALLSSCASVDFEAPKIASHGLQNTNDTYLGRQLEDERLQHTNGDSGHLVFLFQSIEHPMGQLI